MADIELDASGLDEALSAKTVQGYSVRIWLASLAPLGARQVVADAIRAYLNAAPGTGGEGVPPTRPSAPKGALWCQPGDKQDERYFIVRFEDQDRGDAVFTDEAAAREFWARATVSWNCWLFGALPVNPFPATVPVEGLDVNDWQTMLSAVENMRSADHTEATVEARWRCAFALEQVAKKLNAALSRAHEAGAVGISRAGA